MGIPGAAVGGLTIDEKLATESIGFDLSRFAEGTTEEFELGFEQCAALPVTTVTNEIKKGLGIEEGIKEIENLAKGIAGGFQKQPEEAHTKSRPAAELCTLGQLRVSIEVQAEE